MEQDKVPVYRYWKPFNSTEHYLLVSEIAKIWNLYSLSRKKTLHTLLVSTVLKKYCELKKIDSYYYKTRYGLKQVYPKEVHEAAYLWFLKHTNHHTNQITIDGRTFSYSIGRKKRTNKEE